MCGDLRMNLYRFICPLLFLLLPETAHGFALKFLRVYAKFAATKIQKNPICIAGLHFPNRVGIAAGLDKNGDYIDALFSLGCGFIEIGAVTPKPQKGNPKPRLFRLIRQKAIINRMGFNNLGVGHMLEKLRTRKSSGIVGVNLGKNKETPLESAHEDYIFCLEKLYRYADYFSINISSPNTLGLRDLQNAELLNELLKKIQIARDAQVQQTGRFVPLFVKLAPDLDDAALKAIVEVLLDRKIEGVIATNTTLQRPSGTPNEQGGLSGQPLFELSLKTVKRLSQLTAGRLPIIAVGGLASPVQAAQMLAAGASLLQVYTGLIYEGPGLVSQLAATH